MTALARSKVLEDRADDPRDLAVEGSQDIDIVDASEIERLRGPGYRNVKRALDLVGSMILILVLSPVFALIAIAIRIEDRGPAVYRQTRVGKRGRPFTCYKFRSMVMNAEERLETWRRENPALWREYVNSNFKLREDPRVTRVGRFLRATSLDELPQLWNVLIGEMSLVGPRPLIAREISAYGHRIAIYRAMTPGVTGLWQVNGRSETQFEDRVRYDGEYAQRWSLVLDALILLKTVKVVFGKDGAY